MDHNLRIQADQSICYHNVRILELSKAFRVYFRSSRTSSIKWRIKGTLTNFDMNMTSETTSYLFNAIGFFLPLYMYNFRPLVYLDLWAHVWAGSQHFLQDCMRTQCAQSDQSLRVTLDSQGFKAFSRGQRIFIFMRNAGWSETLLGAHLVENVMPRLSYKN